MPAVIYGASSWTYAQLGEEVDGLRAELGRRGCGAGSRVGILTDPCPRVPAALIAIFEAGASCVPLDPEYPAARLEDMASRAEIDLVLTTTRFQGRALTSLPHLLLDTPLPSGRDARPVVQARQEAIIFFTSGSTGAPKGVVLSHRAIASRQLCEQRLVPLSTEDRVLFKTSVSFDVLIRETFAPLLAGGAIVFLNSDHYKSSRAVVETIARHGVTVSSFSPTQLRMFLSTPGASACHSLRHVLSGGEVLTTALRSELADALPGVRLHNIYGPTEAFTASYWDCREHWPGAAVPIGRPTDMDLHVVDDQLHPVAPGGEGQIALAGIGLADGYLDDPEETHRRFVPNPFATSADTGILYLTGDRARLHPDGVLEFLGRDDDQIKLHGVRVNLGGVESVLSGLPGVADCAVAVKTRTRERERLVAYYVPTKGVNTLEARLRTAMRRVLPAPMVPSAFVRLDALPLTTSGKKDRSRLPDPPSRDSEIAEYVGPTTSLERLLAEAWQRGLEVAQVGVTENFFELGGDSLTALSIFEELEGTLGSGLPHTQVFQAPTIRVLAELILERLGPETVEARLRALGRGHSEVTAP